MTQPPHPPPQTQVKQSSQFAIITLNFILRASQPEPQS